MKKILRAKNKFTPETKEKLLAAIRGGNFRVVACQLAGITNKTLYEWLKNPKPEYQEFERCTRAEIRDTDCTVALQHWGFCYPTELRIDQNA